MESKDEMNNYSEQPLSECSSEDRFERLVNEEKKKSHAYANDINNFTTKQKDNQFYS